MSSLSERERERERKRERERERMSKLTGTGIIKKIKDAMWSTAAKTPVGNAVAKVNEQGALQRAHVNVIINGSVGDTVLQKRGVLRGKDMHGNMYYEDVDTSQHGRHRWVVYHDLWNYNATTVPPEWHGWLHHITDDEPGANPNAFAKPFYAAEPTMTKTGTMDKYQPKGAFIHKRQEMGQWKKYRAWTPPN